VLLCDTSLASFAQNGDGGRHGGIVKEEGGRRKACPEFTEGMTVDG
jgi:hypothetical protein